MIYLALGDSITAPMAGVVNYCDALSGAISSPGSTAIPLSQVVNHGVNGYTTSQLLANWATEVTGQVPQIASVMLGTNDHALSGGSPLVSPSDYGTNLAAIITTLQAISHGLPFNGGHPYVVVFGSPYVVSNSSRDEVRLQTYIEIARVVATANGAAFADLNVMTGSMCGWNDAAWIANYTHANDGLHPNTAGHAAMLILIREVLSRIAFSMRIS